jgi:hypothetical protein
VDAIVGKVNQDEVVRPSQLIASVGQTVRGSIGTASMRRAARRDVRLQLLRQRETKRAGRALYGAKLLFEFCVLTNGRAAARRLCEERIVLVPGGSAADAARAAQRQGRANQARYRNPLGQPVAFRFVGVLDLIELGIGCEPNEVWWAFTTRVRPMERRNQIIPHTSKLTAVVDERRRTRNG